MARKKKQQELYVYMNGIHVGMLQRTATGQLIFIYAQDWLNWENSRPVSLSMPLSEIPYKSDVVNAYFDNLLPDSDSIRERMQARFASPSKKCFDLLAAIGGDCVGALQVLTQPAIVNNKTIQATAIDDHEIAIILKNYKIAPLGMDRERDFRISIAGAQEKTALLWYQGKWCLPTGVTPTSHIIKLPIGNIKHSGIDLSESVENEWLCLKILSAYNLPVNQANIVQFDDVKTLVVERFDRHWAENQRWLIRLPQEDCCQALGIPAGLKYESDGGPGIKDIMAILSGSEAAAVDRKKFMKSVFLFWIMGAIDGHAKNFSIAIEAKGRYRLTPLYDVISAYPLVAKRQLEWHDLRMAMALKAKNNHYKWKELQIRHWLAMATRCQFNPAIMQTLIEEICDNMDTVIDEVMQILPPDFPQHIADPIFSGMREVKARCTMN